MKSKNVTNWVIAIAAMLVLLGPLAQKSRGDFVLLNHDQLTVNSSHSHGTLYNWSRAYIVTGGTVEHLYAYDSSAVDVSGGSVLSIGAHDSSTANISGGSITYLSASQSSAANISGGYVEYLNAYDYSTVDISEGCVVEFWVCNFSTVNISGGTMSSLAAQNSSVVTFYGRDFLAGDGLDLDGDRVLGTGLISGEWMDGMRWSVVIEVNDPSATILAIPEPASAAIMVLGATLIASKRRRQ